MIRRLSSVVLAAYLGLLAFLVGVPMVQALGGYAELDPTTNLLRAKQHPNVVDCISGASPACVTHSVTGTVTRTITAVGGLAGTGTANYVAKWTGAATLGNAGIYDSGSNAIGINTTAPGAQVEVYDNTPNGFGLKLHNVGAGGAYPYFSITQMGSTGYGVADWANAGVVEGQAPGGMVFGAYAGPINFQIARSSVMRIATNSRVGIGTTDPSTTLDVRGGARFGTGTDTSSDIFKFSAGDVYIQGMTLEAYAPRLRLKGGTYAGYSDGPLTLEFASGSGKVFRLSQQSVSGAVSMGTSGGSASNLTFDTNGSVGVATLYDTSIALNVGGLAKSTNQVAVEGGHWKYRTGTDTVTSTATAIEALRTSAATLVMTSTFTATSTAMGTLNAASPVHFTIGTATTTYNSAAVSATPTIRVHDRTLAAASPVYLTVPTSTATFSAASMSDAPVVNVRTDTATLYAAAPLYMTVGTSTATYSAALVGNSPTVRMPTATYTSFATGSVTSTAAQVTLGTVTGPAKAGTYRLSYDLTGQVAGVAGNDCVFHMEASGCSFGANYRSAGASGGSHYRFSVAATQAIVLASDTACAYSIIMETENNGLYCIADFGMLWLERLQ